MAQTQIRKEQLDSTLQEQPTEGAFVDGDKTKLDAIEAAADVTDATNVAAAGALMDSDLLDEDDMTSDSATAPASQQSIKAYVDANGGGATTLDGLTDVDTDKSKTPADGDVLTYDGTDWNAEAAAGGGGSSTPRMTYTFGDLVNYAIAAKVETGGTLSASTSGYNRLVLSTGANARSGMEIPVNTDDFDYMGKNPHMSGIVRFAPWSSSDTYKGFWGMGDDVWDKSVTFSLTKHHAAIYFERVSGTLTAYASTADGTTQQTTDITASAAGGGDSENMYHIEVDSGTDVKFYCNGTLVATHSTNIPSTGSYNLAQVAHVRTAAGDDANEMRVYPFTITHDAI